MKHTVTSLLVLVSLFAAGVLAQTRTQGAKKQRQQPAPRSGQLKICQGVALPDGYIIVGYVTSPACPHGAYLLQKQEPPAVAAAAASDRGPFAPPETTKSRPRRVVAVPDSSVQAAPDTSAPPQSPPTLSNAGPSAISLGKAPPAAVPEPSVEEVSAGDIVRIETTLVAVPVSVLDRQGRFVPGLKQEDFRVFENGVEQPIAYFEPTEKPFTVALLLDTSASTRFHLWEIKEAAIAFAKQLRPQDRVLVVTFSDEVLLLTEATSDLNIINTVIQVNANPGSSTRLYDAVKLVISERLNKIQGRKAVVLFTDGVDTSSYMATYDSTMREAEELDALVYPIQYDTTDYMRAMGGTASIAYGVVPNNTPMPGTTPADYQRADRYLQGMAENTGGRLYRANDTSQLAKAFTSIAEELRRQYSLGYYPQTGSAENGERRLIKVSVQKPNVAVRARNSYLRRGSPTQ